MPYDKLVDSAQLDNAITQTANAIRAKTGSADLIEWNTDTGFADAVGSLGGASGGNVSYQSGYRINSSGEQIAYDGYATSDYISCELNNVVYLLNIYMESGVENAGNLRIAFYDSDKVHLGQTNATGAGNNLNGKYEATDGSLSQFTVKSFTDCDLTNVKYIRLCSTKLDGDSVIIVTESGGGSGGGDTGEGCVISATSLPDCITEIGDYAFYNNSHLNVSSLPSKLTKIGSYAFYYCQKLNFTTLPKDLVEIGDAGFFQCKGLQLTELPNGLRKIGNDAFGSCPSNCFTVLPDSIETIADKAFRYNTGLTTITMPLNLKSLGYQIFDNCPNLSTITFKGKPICNLGNFLYYSSVTIINVPWAEGEVNGAPWGATKATINYNYVEE